MPKDCRVVIENPERAEEFMDMFGRKTVCIVNPIPEYVVLEEAQEMQAVYWLDLSELSDEEYSRLVRHIAAKCNASWHQVINQIHEHGLPILARDCYVLIDYTQNWMD